ncbi:MAG: asparagine synthetase B, partial [Bacteroidia bacterium]
MCGIAGIYTTEPAAVKQATLDKMAAVLFHRGPDDTGFWINKEGTVGFAHTRLAIIDLTPGGHQPMEYDDGRYIITFNGEIYNY